MIAQSQNESLRIVAKAASEHGEWDKYAEYCFLREKGLRQEAFNSLNDFLKDAGQWADADKMRFVSFLLPFAETVEDADYGPLPFPLREKLIKPTLKKWCETEEQNSTPFRWYGCVFQNSEYLKKAIEINPADDTARNVLLNWGIDSLYYATHHIPEYYIGDVNDDLESIAEVKNHIAKLADNNSREYWTKELNAYAELVENYAEWKDSGHSNLEKWGEENNKRVNSGIRHYYYAK